MAQITKEYINDDWEVLTPTGYQSFESLGETIPYRKYRIHTSNGVIECADDHVFYTLNPYLYDDVAAIRENAEYTWFTRFPITAKELQQSDILVGEYDASTETVSMITVHKVEITNDYETMYDLIDVAGGNVYYTNGILSHNSSVLISWIIHYCIFNANRKVAILANKERTARELLERLKFAYESLPKFLQQGVVEWNKGSVKFENGSKVLASSTSSTAIRGETYNVLMLDEFAWVPPNVADEFFSSVYPTISSGQTSKCIIISTPKGLNLFYKIWTDAVYKRNAYIPIEAAWNDVPGRDEAWKEQQIANTSEDQFRVEFSGEFLGSTSTLIAPSKLRSMSFKPPIKTNQQGLKIYEYPKTNHVYMATVDTGAGVGQDYHAISVFDITSVPYKQVATFYNNTIEPSMMSGIIDVIAKQYNQAHVLIEINGLGKAVADTLLMDLEYPNIVQITFRGRRGQVYDGGFGDSAKVVTPGIQMSGKVKSAGCTILKSLVENDQLMIEDFNTIKEMVSFILQTKGVYAAEEGSNDDLMMTLVIFAWITQQKAFEDLTNAGLKEKMLNAEREKALLDDFPSLPMIDDGTEPVNIDMGDGLLWSPAHGENRYTDDLRDDETSKITSDKDWLI